MLNIDVTIILSYVGTYFFYNLLIYMQSPKFVTFTVHNMYNLLDNEIDVARKNP